MELFSHECKRSSDDKVLQVLQLVVQHVELSYHNLAKLLTLNSSVNSALQQAVGRLSVGLESTVFYGPSLQPRALARITSFGAWLPKHPGLVQELKLGMPYKHMNPQETAAWAAAEQVITFALQIACQGSPAAAGAGLSSSAGAAGARKQQAAGASAVLQLRLFHSNFIHSPAALQSLALCTSLTQLKLDRIEQERFTPAFCAALASMRSLQHLECDTKWDAETGQAAYPPSFAEALAQLTKLKVLHALSGMPLAGLAQLPASLTVLNLAVDHPAGEPPADVHLAHLSTLLKLQLEIPGGISAQSQWPASFTYLSLLGPAEAVPGLHALKYMQLRTAAAAVPLLQRLKQLPQLQHVQVGVQGCSGEQAEEIAAVLALATQLTALQIFNTDAAQEQDDFHPHVNFEDVGLDEYLQELHQLQLLHMSGIRVDPLDAVHFTALSALTDLKLAYCEGFDDLAVAAMMQRLTGLRRLHLESLGLDNQMMWVSAACLTNLEHLHCMLNPAAAVTEQTLHLLAPLTQLTSLTLDMHEAEGAEGSGVHAIPRAVKRRFLAGMPLLKGITWT